MTLANIDQRHMCKNGEAITPEKHLTKQFIGEIYEDRSSKRHFRMGYE